MQLGSQGDAVSAVQSQLALRGMDVNVDGDFGPQTEAAVRTFQTNVFGLGAGPGTGIVDVDTWAALVNGYPRASTRSQVAPERALASFPQPLIGIRTGQDAQGDVHLLKARVDAKQAELAEAHTLLQRAQHVAERQERLKDTRVGPEGELEQARSELAVQEARARANEAPLRAGRLRVAQADRRRAELSSSGGRPDGAATNPHPAGAVAGEGVSDSVGSGSAPLGQHAAPVEIEPRLRDLENKVNAMLKEMEALRRAMKPPPRSGRP